MSKVFIAVPTGEFARRADFYDYFGLMDKPEGTIIAFSHGQSPARNRNVLIDQALEHGATHILFLDDDVIVPKDIIAKLIRHDKDIVTGLYLLRNFPHKPIIFSYADEKGACTHRFIAPDEPEGLIPIINCGLGCCLIKIEVFQTMPRPWITLGELEKDHWCDDIAFFNRARDYGFSLFCDLSVRVGHIASCVIYPEYSDGKWLTSYDTNGESRLTYPMVQPA